MQNLLSRLQGAVTDEAAAAFADDVTSSVAHADAPGPGGSRLATRRAPSTTPLRKILVATDFSPAAAMAVQSAVALANQCQAALTILHVIDISAPSVSGPASDLMPRLWEEGAARMGRLACAFAGRMEARTMLAEGLPWEVIAEVSRDFDLLVLAASQSAGWRLFPRHTSRRLLDEAACPVMLVPDDEPRRP